MTPSIKGTIFRRTADDMAKLVANGEISARELERRLPPAALELLNRKVLPVEWVDVSCHASMVELLRDIEGDGRNDYLVGRGEQTAQSLLDRGLYKGLGTLRRAEGTEADSLEARRAVFEEQARPLVQLTNTFLNFTRQALELEESGDRYRVEMSEAEAYPEVLCWTQQGFMNRLCEEGYGPYLWSWERPTPDLIVYRMGRPV